MTPDQLAAFKAGQKQGTTDYFVLGTDRFESQRFTSEDMWLAGYFQGYDLAEVEHRY